VRNESRLLKPESFALAEAGEMVAVEIFAFVGIALIFIGVLIIAITVLLKSKRSGGKADVKAGGAVIIGPVPIVFGTDKKTVKTVLVLAIVLMALALAVTIVNYLLAG
jgi:uncharacterized protein (TIGR00304 family)